VIRALLIEDNSIKQERIKRVIERGFDAEVQIVGTIIAAYPNIEKLPWDIVILDMTFQILRTGIDAGMQALAGVELLQFMTSKEITTPVIVVTQHETFTQPGHKTIRSIAELDRLLRDSFPNVYHGTIHANLASESWHEELIAKIAVALHA